jgi:hypothetical protein
VTADDVEPLSRGDDLARVGLDDDLPTAIHGRVVAPAPGPPPTFDDVDRALLGPRRAPTTRSGNHSLGFGRGEDRVRSPASAAGVSAIGGDLVLGGGQRPGNARTGARDPLRTLGACLANWSQRLNDLPAQFHGRRGDYQLEQARSLAARLGAPPDTGAAPACPPASADHRTAQRAAFAAYRAKRRAERVGRR